jgi:hypothetical protein
MLTNNASFFARFIFTTCLVLMGACGDSPRVCGTAGRPACVADGDVAGEQCGGFAGIACSEGDFCDYAPDASCGNGDQLGMCRTIPSVCPGVVDPVCGCDQTTYSNACAAAAAGVSVLHDGDCD